jgi:hypothetical protein
MVLTSQNGRGWLSRKSLSEAMTSSSVAPSPKPIRCRGDVGRLAPKLAEMLKTEVVESQ